MHDISRRPQFARLVDDIRAGNIYRVFVRDFWSISRNASQLREFIALCQEHDTSVSFVDQDFDTWEDDPRIWRLFHQALAEMDGQNVSDAVTSM
jgi:DNA invertase Pin-like site-specific DNA recombinase